MERRQFLTSALGAGAFATLSSEGARGQVLAQDGANDRRYMLDLLNRMASPVLEPMSRGKLQATFTPELSPTWDGRNRKIAYLECFGRLMSGIAPWLALPDDGSAEGQVRARLRQHALASYALSVDPASPDYLFCTTEAQALVDAAYFTNAFVRAPSLWRTLDATTQQRIVAEIKKLRQVPTVYNVWVLFAAMNEAFLLSVGEEWDPVRIDLAIHKINEWYVGDGWYSDGPQFHFDYYGSYAIHPMLVETLDVLVSHGAGFISLQPKDLQALAYRRMQRFGEHLERLIGPDGSYAPIGRSLTYRTAVFQPLGLLAWRKRLPESLTEGQVRAATMAAQRAMFRFPSNFDAKGYLTIGFTGHQPELGDVYSNAGSMYIVAESFVSLGLSPNDSYWTAPASPWTMKRAASGLVFPKDHYVDF